MDMIWFCMNIACAILCGTMATKNNNDSYWVWIGLVNAFAAGARFMMM